MKGLLAEGEPPHFMDHLQFLGEHRIRTRHYFPERFFLVSPNDLIAHDG